MNPRMKTRPRLTSVDIERRADTPADRMMLGCSAPYVAYRYAQERGWVTDAEVEQARGFYGNLWNYCGD